MVLRQLRCLPRQVVLRYPTRAAASAGAGCCSMQTRRPFGTGERKRVMAVDLPSGAPYEPLPISLITPQTFDPSAPLRIPKWTTEFLSKRTSPSTSLSGHVSDLFPYFHACIATGKLDRAELVLQRLYELSNNNLHDQLVGLHNKYLRACIERVQETDSGELAEALHSWYEVQIRGNELPQTTETIACMVKAAVLSTRPESPRRTQLIRRYMSMAPGDAGYEVLYYDDIIDDEDLDAVLASCPQYEMTTEDEMAPSDDETMASAPESAASVDVSAFMSAKDGQPAIGRGMVRATPQKGVGLDSLKQALHLIDSMKNGLDVSTLPQPQQRELQRQLELDSIEAALQRWRSEAENMREVGAATATSNPGMRARLYKWQVALEAELHAEIARCDESERAKTKTPADHDRCAYGAFLKQGDVARMAAVTLLAVLNMAVSSQMIDRGLAVIQVVPRIGASIEEDIRSQAAKIQQKKIVRARRRVAKTPQHVSPEDEELIKQDDARRAAIKARYAAARLKVLGRTAGAQPATESAAVPDAATADGAAAAAAAAATAAESQPAAQADAGADNVPKTSLVEEEQESTQAPTQPRTAHDKSSQIAMQLQDEADKIIAATISNATADDDAPRRSAEEYTPIFGTEWTPKVRTKLGAAALTALINTAEMRVSARNDEGFLVSEEHPVFQHSLQLRKGRKVGYLLFHPELCRILRSEPTGDFLAKHLPMLVKPRPWTGIDRGGFLASSSSLVRFKLGDRDQRIYIEAALKRNDLDDVLEGLDVLGRTAWKIHRQLFDVMVQAWNTGEAIANFPALGARVPVPTEPVSDDVGVRSAWTVAVKRAKGEEMGMHSVRCSINFQLEIARAYRDQTMYFPHNVDFRGRAYPMPTYLNHMGADHVRALLVFAEGKRLGARGLQWLKVHLANVYGFDKASLEEREAFASAHMADILDSAKNPLGGSRWWLQGEDPWQCLATCMELKSAYDLADPAEYVSNLPIHQDGTCNGLQHYAALGGDEWGARQVNLEPGERPADVYTAVADLVRQQVARDAASDSELSKFAKAVDGKVTRKVVKQTVMTNVYGVTFSGARAQVLRQLDDLYPNIEKETGIPATVLAYYLATLVFSAMGNMFSGAHGIQSWLGDIGGRVCLALTPDQIRRIERGKTTSHTVTIHKKLTKDSSIAQAKRNEEELPKEFQTSIVWTTPLRMPVAQPYRKPHIRLIETCLQDLQFNSPERTDPVDRRKQLQAFPPNFIHSLDASHMLLSALNCDKRGLTFAAVHDSFWTHACDVDSMNVVLREAFVSIHSEPVIERLAAEFRARYEGALYLARIDEASDAAGAIRAWRRHPDNKAHSPRDELLLENKRQRLLASTSEQDVEEGKAMVTPGSLYEAFKNRGDLASEDDLEGTRLGMISDEGSSNDDAIQDAVSATPQAASEGVAVADEDGGDDVAAAAAAAATTTTTKLSAADAAVAAKEAGQAEAMQEMSSKALEGAQRGLDRHGKSNFGDKVVRHISSNTAAPAAAKKTYLRVWLPLELPPVPDKGTFDVRRLLQSQYFFS